MKHLDSELIQKYIDNEVSQSALAHIDAHLFRCVVCRNAVDEQRKLAAEIRDAINILSEEVVEIPVFSRPIKGKEVKSRRVMLRWSLCAAAACILFFMMLVLKPEKDTPVDAAASFLHTENEVDANRSILQQDIVVKMTDSEGNTAEFNL